MNISYISAQINEIVETVLPLQKSSAAHHDSLPRHTHTTHTSWFCLYGHYTQGFEWMKRKTNNSKINSTLRKPLTDDSQLLFKLKASGVMQTERWKLKEVAIILHFKISSGYVSLFMCLDRSSQAFHFVHALVSFHLPLQSVCQGSLNKTLNSESYSSIVLLLEYLFSAVWSKFYSVVFCFLM